MNRIPGQKIKRINRNSNVIPRLRAGKYFNVDEGIDPDDR